MRNPERIPIILEQLKKIWTEHPDMRLGQLLVGAVQKRTGVSDIFYVEDETLLKMVKEIFG